MIKETLKFSIVLKTIPVEITHDDGTTQPYILRELTGAARDEWADQNEASFKRDAEGKVVGVTSNKGFTARLISACLFDAAGKNVPEAVVQGWPASMQNALHKEASKLNGIEVKAKEDGAKKE